MNKEDYNDKIISDAVKILNEEGVIIVPTDTVYGLAIKSDSEVAINKIYKMKKRNVSKRLPMIVDSYDRLLSLCDVDINVLKKFQPFFPGKLTLVLKKKNSDETVAVRMINNEILNRIIDELNCPLLLTSANISGKETSNDIMKIIDDFDGLVDMVIIGNKLSGVSSTIVELKDDKISLIREGSISFREIEESFYRR